MHEIKEPVIVARDRDRHHTKREHGITEIVPADQPGCAPGQPPKPRLGAWVRLWEMRSRHFDLGICTGANIASPPIGTRVEIVGPYVLDAKHGWMEIHPVWSVKLLDSVR